MMMMMKNKALVYINSRERTIDFTPVDGKNGLFAIVTHVRLIQFKMQITCTVLDT